MRRKILVIDDNELVGRVLRARLWAADYDVTVVTGAQSAFEVLGKGRFDLVLLDLEMPDLDGLEVLAVIRTHDLAQGAPVVLLTSSDETRNLLRARELGARGYLTKDHAAETLLKNVDRLLSGPSALWLDDLHCLSQSGLPASGVHPMLTAMMAQPPSPANDPRQGR